MQPCDVAETAEIIPFWPKLCRYPRDPPYLKRSMESKFAAGGGGIATAIAKRYRECSAVLVFLGKRGRKTVLTVTTSVVAKYYSFKCRTSFIGEPLTATRKDRHRILRYFLVSWDGGICVLLRKSQGFQQMSATPGVENPQIFPLENAICCIS